MTTPPPFAERLLRAAVRDPEWRDAITGDLREELASLAARRGVSVARRWYWRQAVPLALRFAVGRVVPAATPSRQRVSIRDVEAASTLGAGWSRELRHAWRGVVVVDGTHEQARLGLAGDERRAIGAAAAHPVARVEQQPAPGLPGLGTVAGVAVLDQDRPHPALEELDAGSVRSLTRRQAGGEKQCQ